MSVSVLSSALCLQDYLAELQTLLRSLSETDFQLNSPEFWPAAFYRLSQQEQCLKVRTGRTHTFAVEHNI